MSTCPLTNRSYTVGWICALASEMVAAKAMLDENHGRPKEQHVSDQNSYSLGRIGEHNIVIACLPAGVYGTASAAKVAADMQSSFESIRFGLMVGIGGGVPSAESDIRLGDVVISKPGQTSGGVVQYDFGKTTEEGRFTRIGSLNRPPQVLLTAVSSLEADHMMEESKISEFLSEMWAKYPKLQTDFKYQGPSNDLLYQADYDHTSSGNTCESCDGTKLIHRPAREHSEPVIHLGIIASGNQVMKHGITRDRLKTELNVLCFEMEAAGLVDNFPCIVIRGICDYADSHKTKRWQKYAAATAAAYAKELLRIIPANQVAATRTVTEALMDDHHGQKILNWLSTIDYGTQQADFITRRQKDTGLWLLNCEEFGEWANGAERTLFCPGIPGAGKTMMASIVVDHLWKAFHDGKTSSDYDTGIAVLYCNYQRREEQTAVHLVASLLKQLATNQSSTLGYIESLYENHIKRGTRPSFDEISKTLRSVIATYSRVFIVIDALDECGNDDGTRRILLSEIQHLQTLSNAKLMATSRFIPDITDKFEGAKVVEIRASDEDVGRYFEGQMSRLPDFVRRNTELQQFVKQSIIKAVDGMFLLAQLHFDSLVDKMTEKAIKSALGKLPKGSEALGKAYENAIERINSQLQGHRELAKNVLSWITYAKRPLTTGELQHALAVEPGESKLDMSNILDVKDMVSVCAGLVTVDQESNIVRLVHYTTQEYFEQQGLGFFPDALVRITSACVSYLSFNAFRSGQSLDDKHFEARLADYVFLDYAARYWGDHAYKVQPIVEELVTMFLRNESLVSSSNQAMSIPEFKFREYSQNIPMQVTGLHLAAIFGLESILRALLKHNEQADFEDSYGRTPLLWAARNRHEAVIKLLLEKGADVESKSISGQTPLSWAAKNGHEAVVKLLIEKGADIKSKDSVYGQTPLLWAVKNGHEAVVKLLLEKGADVESKNSAYGQTPLSWAAKNGNEAVVKLLLEKGADVESKDSESGQTPLSWAARKGHKAVVRLLLEKGTDVESKSISGQTPLSWATEEGHEAVVRLLVEKGADIESKDSEYGQTPLSWATRNGHEAVMKLLIKKGANIEFKNSEYGKMPLLWAAKNGREALVKLLIKKGADIESKDSIYGQTPLSWAAREGCEAVVKLLIKKGADIESKDSEYGQMPLLWAARYGQEVAVKLLVEKGANIESKDKHGQTPLSWAAENGHDAVIRLLLEKDANIDSKDSEYGQTPLLWAARKGHRAVVWLLLEKGADIESKDSLYGQTALSWAARKGREAVVRLLLEKGADIESKSISGQTPLSWAIEEGHEAVIKLLK